jgi:hypothetical protein
MLVRCPHLHSSPFNSLQSASSVCGGCGPICDGCGLLLGLSQLGWQSTIYMAGSGISQRRLSRGLPIIFGDTVIGA